MRAAPYLLAVAFPLAMWLNNLAEEPAGWDVAATFAIALAVAAATDAGLRRFVRRAEARCVAASLCVVCCLGYGHVFELVAAWGVLHRALMPVWLAACGAACAGVLLPRRPTIANGAARLLTIVCPLLLVVQVGGAVPSIGGLWPRQAAAATTKQLVRAAESPASAEAAAQRDPDIYYIILDAYARQDVLREIHGYDNGPFVAELRRRGFFVPDSARANYSQTRLALASSLSMDYLPLADSDDGYDEHHATIRSLRQNGRVVERLRERGYRYRYVGNPYFPHDPAADEELTLGEHDDRYLTAFVSTTLFGRPLKRLLAWAEVYSDPVAVHNFQLGHIAAAKTTSAPLFTFCHICCPHSPYVYDRRGPLPRRVPDEEAGSRHYVGQLQYLNGRVLELLDAIDRASGPEAVVVLQADHGSDDLGLPPSSDPERLPPHPTERQLFERMSIFAAYRCPAEVRARLYPTMTPVNSFRLLLGGLFGDDYPLLADRSLYSTYDRPFRYIESGERVTR